MKIGLRSLEESDSAQIARLINNKKIWDNLRDYIPYPYKMEDADYFIDCAKKQPLAQTFAIILDDGELCGVISLESQSDIYRMTAELGYWIGEKYWGKGIATKAIALITKHGFEELKLERIYAGVFGFNIPSMKVLEKNGYALEGVFRNAIIKNDKILDEHVFAKLKR